MKKYLCTLTISISLFLIAGPVYAQWDVPNLIAGNINECVSCGTGDPLNGVVLTVDRIGGEPYVHPIEEEGEGVGYLIMGGNGGSYTLTFEKPGYTTVTLENICVDDGHNHCPNIVVNDVCLSKK
jgi:hypothetical protein